MNVVDNRNTKKGNNKYQTTNIMYDKNSISIINKIITKSKSHQIKPEQNNLTYAPIEKNMGHVLNANGDKKSRRCEVQKYVSIFENK